jgi:putative membrane protein
MTDFQPLTGPTNELAKERTRQAAERTLSAWINNCLILIGFGVAIDPLAGRLGQLFPNRYAVVTTQLANRVGLMFIALGIGILIIALAQHIVILRFLRQGVNSFDTNLFLKLNWIAVSMVLTFGVLSLAIILLDAS